MNENFQLNLEYFGSFSREAMKALLFMAKKWPKKRTFSTDDLAQFLKTKGRALGGVLATFSKRQGESLIIKAGTITIGWEGQRFPRPKQVWTLNPKLKDQQIKNIIEILEQFRLDH